MVRVPALESAGLKTFFCGPESFMPDVRYHLGQAPELDNCFVAAGLNSIGLQSAGGDTARGVRRSPLYDRLQSIGACHGEVAGWERPNWYAPEPGLAGYEYSYGRQNWFEHSAREHRAVRERVGLFDLSSFAKFRLQGTDAARVLNHVCANDVDVRPGRIVYTQWLNARGGIEADLTVTRLAENDYLIVTAAATEVRDFHWLQRHIPADAHCVLTNVTSGLVFRHK